MKITLRKLATLGVSALAVNALYPNVGESAEAESKSVPEKQPGLSWPERRKDIERKWLIRIVIVSFFTPKL